MDCQVQAQVLEDLTRNYRNALGGIGKKGCKLWERQRQRIDIIGYLLPLKYLTIIHKYITCSVWYKHVLCSPLYCDYRSQHL